MTHLERFISTVEHLDVDRPASWLGMPTAGGLQKLLRHFGAKNLNQLKNMLDDDIWPVDVPYNHPPANHIACAFDFARKDGAEYEERTLTTPGFFEDVTDIGAVNDFPWPNPADHIDTEHCRRCLIDIPDDYAVMGVMWSAHFQDACAAFGMETALMRMIDSPDLYKAVIDRITDFYLDANKIFYEACGKRLNLVLLGNDFGSQTALMLSPQLIRELVLPGTVKLIEQAHSYGYKVMYHSCGAIREIIPDLINAGADIIHPIQALATGMDALSLSNDFSGQVAFCGGIDTQQLLASGTPTDVAEKISELRNIFPTGLVFSPSHEAIMPDTRPENIAAIFDALKRN